MPFSVSEDVQKLEEEVSSLQKQLEAIREAKKSGAVKVQLGLHADVLVRAYKDDFVDGFFEELEQKVEKEYKESKRKLLKMVDLLKEG